jgi:hypothetical protein
LKHELEEATISRIGRTGVWIVLSIVLVLLVLECALCLSNLRAAHRARQLFEEVRSLSPGQSTDQGIQRIVQKYGGDTGRRWGNDCGQVGPSAKTYAVDVESEWDNWIGSRDILHNIHLRLFGATVWRANAFFGLQDGHLTCVHYRVVSIPRGAASAYSSLDYRLRQTDTDAPFGVSFADVHNAKALEADVNTEASAGERNHAFDFNLSCLTRIGGCRNVCEVMPSARKDYQAKARAEGNAIPAEGRLPSDELSDPECSAP